MTTAAAQQHTRLNTPEGIRRKTEQAMAPCFFVRFHFTTDCMVLIVYAGKRYEHNLPQAPEYQCTSCTNVLRSYLQYEVLLIGGIHDGSVHGMWSDGIF